MSTATLTIDRVDQGLQFSVEVGDPPFTMITDSGEGAVAANPVHLVLVAAGGCSAMDVIGILRKQRQAVTAYQVIVTSERRQEHPRAFTRIDLLHRVTGRDISARALIDAIRLSDTTYCSVHATLSPTVAMTSRYEIRTPDGAVVESGTVAPHEAPR